MKAWRPGAGLELGPGVRAWNKGLEGVRVQYGGDQDPAVDGSANDGAG